MIKPIVAARGTADSCGVNVDVVSHSCDTLVGGVAGGAVFVSSDCPSGAPSAVRVPNNVKSYVVSCRPWTPIARGERRCRSKGEGGWVIRGYGAIAALWREIECAPLEIVDDVAVTQTDEPPVARASTDVKGMSEAAIAEDEARAKMYSARHTAQRMVAGLDGGIE